MVQGLGFRVWAQDIGLSVRRDGLLCLGLFCRAAGYSLPEMCGGIEMGGWLIHPFLERGGGVRLCHQGLVV